MPVIATTRLWTAAECTAYLCGLVALDIEQMKAGEVTQWLYASSIRYQAEPLGSEVWQSARELYKSGVADCEDLVALRVAEYRHRLGVPAIALVKDVRPGLRHCLVLLPNGALECPSRQRGMGRPGGLPVSTGKAVVLAGERV